ncbi:hypothetical protein O1M54_12300 [Streptomyces diastatochromogenes]|nr:hypothetical protein [Streptomyces diastatochromogenes]
MAGAPGRAFPPRLRTADPAGVDVVLLDAGIAGCVSVWRKNGGRLDAGRQRTLLHCARELERALPLVTDAEGFGICCACGGWRS